jgi:hypothetical protein
MDSANDEAVEPFTAHYPPADITPAEFEEFVGEMFTELPSEVTNLRVETLDRIDGLDGSFVFDATVRYELGGMEFLVVIEVKKHSNPIKRELLQVLQSKKESVGAHKAVLVSTAPFQRGAIEFARTHRIALIGVTEGRFTFETRSIDKPPPLSREQAAELWGTETFVAFHYFPEGETGLRATRITGHPEYALEVLLDNPAG